jgi:hypothetical protein
LDDRNTYKRRDTINKRHALCIDCYRSIQRDIAERRKLHRFCITIRRGSHEPIVVHFDTAEEKQEYVRQRNSLSKFSRPVFDPFQSPNGKTACHNGKDLLICDVILDDGSICGGLLRYDEKWDLVCEKCFTISDDVPFYQEVKPELINEYYTWSGEDADMHCYDVTYQKYYSKRR